MKNQVIQVDWIQLEQLEQKLLEKKNKIKGCLLLYQEALENVSKGEKEKTTYIKFKTEYEKWVELVEELEWFCKVVAYAKKQYTEVEQEIMEMLDYAMLQS